MTSHEKIARILKSDPQALSRLEERLAEVTGMQDTFSRVLSENNELMRERLEMIGLTMHKSGEEIFENLIKKVREDDAALFDAMKKPDWKTKEGCEAVGRTAELLSKQPKGYFLKLDKAREFIMKEPPRHVMSFLGYKTPEEMLDKEDIFEIYSALRFVEGGEWENTVFFKQYEKLSPNDFEEREITVRSLSEKWHKEAHKFVVKKYHNISHLKEMGIVFIIPDVLGIPGELLRMFALILHYLHEITFYSALFRDNAKKPDLFPRNFESLLRGDVRLSCPGDQDKCWLVIQRYLAKDNEQDPRLFLPHINPEALHWLKASEDIGKLGEVFPHLAPRFEFWSGLDWVGDYFLNANGAEDLISFNLVDTVMELVKEKELTKYRYHHQEALWNKIFMSYFGREKLEDYCRQYLLEGYFAA